MVSVAVSPRVMVFRSRDTVKSVAFARPERARQKTTESKTRNKSRAKRIERIGFNSANGNSLNITYNSSTFADGRLPRKHPLGPCGGAQPTGGHFMDNKTADLFGKKDLMETMNGI
jgi:hypothetical protein